MASTIASLDADQPVIIEVPVSAVPPPALHRGESDLPFVPYQEGVTFQLIQVDIEAGFFVVESAENRAGPSSGTSTPARSLRSRRRALGSTLNIPRSTPPDHISTSPPDRFIPCIFPRPTRK